MCEQVLIKQNASKALITCFRERGLDWIRVNDRRVLMMDHMRTKLLWSLSPPTTTRTPIACLLYDWTPLPADLHSIVIAYVQ